MSVKSTWLDEAKKSRRLLFDKWEELGKPKKDFYAWLVDQVDASITAAKGHAKLDNEFRRHLEREEVI